MTDPRTDLDNQIAQLELALQAHLPSVVRQLTLSAIDDLRAKRSAFDILFQHYAHPPLEDTGDVVGGDVVGGDVVGGDVVGGDKVAGDKVGGNKITQSYGNVTISDDARINGIVVGVNLGRIIYGRDPQEDERRRLVWYLSRLSAKLYHLPLRGLEERLDQGKGIALPNVYTALADKTRALLLTKGPAKELTNYFINDEIQNDLKPQYHPDNVLPDEAVVQINGRLINNGKQWEQLPTDRSTIPPDKEISLFRSFFIPEVIQYLYPKYKQIVLLGDPGSGKSTFFRHFAWALTQRSLDQHYPASALFGWDEQSQVLPVILSLRTLARQLSRAGLHDETTYNAIRDEIQSYNVQQVDDLLSQALHNGVALLLFDGLDEVPLEITATTADRRTTVEAIRSFTLLYPQTRVVVTCRTRAFEDGLRTLLDWPVETIAPFTLGQIRHFIPIWYTELVAKGQMTTDQRDRLSQILLDTIIARPKIQAMAQTPLLLTMMALVLYNKGELPRDRPQLYERILELLLGQWDQVRDGQSLTEAIGLPDWGSNHILPLLDHLSYEAHAAATSADGRGRLQWGSVHKALIDLFKATRVPQPGDVALRCLEYIEQRSGLLTPDDNGSYIFAHLTLQEHCAGRYIALGTDNPVALVMRHRRDDRWREPIMLGSGLMHQAILNSVLSELIEREEQGQPKPAEDWYRDLIFAAEIGADRDWNYLRTRPLVKVDRLQRDLRHGLAILLNDKDQLIPIGQRTQAAFLLGDLGDPRYPVALEQWKAELSRAQAGNMDSYFCYVPAGSYKILNDTGTQSDKTSWRSITFDTPFLITRYPITNSQWLGWFRPGQYPRQIEDSRLNQPNQPLVSISLDLCNAFCIWLTEQLGRIVRLPTENEWEAAARGGDTRRYPWGKTWQNDRAACQEDEEIRGGLYTPPVGCYPTGAAPCGALDMAGTVREWTINQKFNGVTNPTSFEQIIIRGGNYNDSKDHIGCGIRYKVPPSKDLLYGFRLVVTL